MTFPSGKAYLCSTIDTTHTAQRASYQRRYQPALTSLHRFFWGPARPPARLAQGWKSLVCASLWGCLVPAGWTDPA